MAKGRLVAALYLVTALAVFLILYEWRYNVKEMDWDCDRRTTFSEILEAPDVGMKVGRFKGGICKEYFSLKDGFPIKLACAENVCLTNGEEISAIDRRGGFRIVIPRMPVDRGNR
jgi:hypothetical protein